VDAETEGSNIKPFHLAIAAIFLIPVARAAHTANADVQDGTHIGRAAHEQRLRACGEILEGSLDGICRARA
jgi:hypothetical protein